MRRGRKERQGREEEARRGVTASSYPSCPMDPTTSADLGPADDAKRSILSEESRELRFSNRILSVQKQAERNSS